MPSDVGTKILHAGLQRAALEHFKHVARTSTVVDPGCAIQPLELVSDIDEASSGTESGLNFVPWSLDAASPL